MKNSHIKPGQLVPAELRLEIYKEAKRSIEAGDTNKKHKTAFDLFVLLESILYGEWHKDLLEQDPYYSMFPEFKSYMFFSPCEEKQKALSELTKAIEKLENRLSMPNNKGQQAIKTNIATHVNDNINELPFDAALDCFVQIRENMRERRDAEIAALEQPKNERLIYLKNLEL